MAKKDEKQKAAANREASKRNKAIPFPPPRDLLLGTDPSHVAEGELDSESDAEPPSNDRASTLAHEVVDLRPLWIFLKNFAQARSAAPRRTIHAPVRCMSCPPPSFSATEPALRYACFTLIAARSKSLLHRSHVINAGRRASCLRHWHLCIHTATDFRFLHGPLCFGARANSIGPIRLYTHPVHLSTTYPGVNPSNSTINMINTFLDWAQEQPNVWIINSAQLLAWMQNPKSIADLDQVDALKCSTPQVDASTKICNGIPANENGLLSHCDFPDFPFFTCYGCPEIEPTVDNPNPQQQVPDGQQQRFRLPANCSTPFWDPIAGKCLCTSATCDFVDNSQPIGPNGANLTGGGTGGAAGASASPASQILQ
ncbi:hypothetical protein C8F04DRAFT_1255893 [Mycena alexandri]|uniref:Uncharacterized protein n=1 Tax=Mycena alexandri TaxID=1745969 RepID=A0AAD6T3N3_9AGAR|nr:hypothetical protein C8F04DRAFT_1255893 [Mycena alexandri]